MTEEQREKRNAYMRKWRKANPQRARAISRVANKKFRAADPEKERIRLREWKRANRAKISAAAKAQRAADPEKTRAADKKYRDANRDKIKAHNAKWEKANPEKVRAMQREWGKANPNKVRDKYRRWSRAHPEAVRAAAHRRRSRELGAEGSYAAADIERLFEKQRGKCAACKAAITRFGRSGYHVDHVQPLTKDGSNWPENLQLLCRSCNSKKGAMDPMDWAARHGKLFC